MLPRSDFSLELETPPPIRIVAQRRDAKHFERDLADAPVLVDLEMQSIAVTLEHVAPTEREVIDRVARFGCWRIQAQARAQRLGGLRRSLWCDELIRSGVPFGLAFAAAARHESVRPLSARPRAGGRGARTRRWRIGP